MALSDCFNDYLNALGIPKLKILKSVLQSLLPVLNIKKIDLGLSEADLTLRGLASTAKLAILEPIYSAVLGSLDKITSTFIPGGENCPQVSDMVESVKDGLEKEVKDILDAKKKKSSEEKTKGKVTAKKNRVGTLITFINEVIAKINTLIP